MISLRRRWLGALLCVGFLLTAGVTAARAQGGGPTDDEVNRIAKGLYCPVCENVPLDVCPTQACIQWRALIHEKLAAGWSEQEIKDYFVDQYGDRVLATPPARGLNWLIYLLPPAAILAGAGVLVGVHRSWRRADSGPPTETVGASQDPYVKRMEAELLARRSGGADAGEEG